jgi:diguanylate cyclase (GGDEF)-like protein
MSPYWLVALAIAASAGLSAWICHLLLRTNQRASQTTADERTATVNRLLDFSQTIHGAGKADQVYATLSHFLRTELDLSGIAILTAEADTQPPIQLRFSWPRPIAGPTPMSDMETAMCPCLRQNLPRTFRPDGSPVRCAIDASLSLPENQPAYCIPFTIGLKSQGVAHMLLAPGKEWTESRRQLAEAYVNTANSVLTNLNLLAEAEKQSMTDPLTGLYNRRSLEQLMEREVALAERHNLPLSVVMIDLDHFKLINDEHGHAAGDHMLKSFADCVRITLRKTDLAFRYGGDEFVIALPQTPIAQAQQVVQKVRQAFLSVDFTHAITRLENHPTLSIGVAERSKATNILSLANLLAAADQALYAAKNNNRNCIKVFEPPQAA